jgi:FkbM family methyltransferase
MKDRIKNLLIHSPANHLSENRYIFLMIVYGWIFRLLGNRNALKQVKLLNQDMDCYELEFWNQERWRMFNPVRINRYIKGIEYAGSRLLNRYHLNNLPEKINCFVDVGANVGELSYYFAKRNFFVFSFEPDPYVNSVLSKNLAQFKNVTISKDALGNKRKKLDLYLKSDSADTSLIKSKGFTEIVKVNVSRFDELKLSNQILTPAILKIDAEGFEPEVIEGFKNALEKFTIVSIDCGRERNGADTVSEVESILRMSEHLQIKVFEDMIIVARRNNEFTKQSSALN